MSTIPTETDPLDTLLPQAPRDWANHVLYSALGAFPWLMGWSAGMAHPSLFAALVMLLLGGGKKAWDYYHEHETMTVCIAKTIATAAFPLSWVLVELLPRL
jgi:hypothetical protein